MTSHSSQSERPTHVVVPAVQLERLAGHIIARREVLSRRGAQPPVIQHLRDLEGALLAAARGESVEWPS